MPKSKGSEYSERIRERLKLILKIAGLEVAGFSEYTKISESHVYALINGTRKLSGDIANQIGAKFNIPGWQILQLDYEIPKSIKKTPSLLQFRHDHKDVAEYFSDTVDKRKSSHFIEFELLKGEFLDNPKYVWEINDECRRMQREYASKNLAQILKYLVEKEKLNSEKRLIKKRNGEFGKRLVDVYWKG